MREPIEALVVDEVCRRPPRAVTEAIEARVTLRCVARYIEVCCFSGQRREKRVEFEAGDVITAHSAKPHADRAGHNRGHRPLIYDKIVFFSPSSRVTFGGLHNAVIIYAHAIEFI